MTVTIDLSPDLEARLRSRAARGGKDIESFVRSLVEREALNPEDASEGGSLADLLVGRVGLFHSGGKCNSRETGKAFTDLLEARRERTTP